MKKTIKRVETVAEIKKPIYREWFQEDGDYYHYWKIIPSNVGKWGNWALGVSFRHKKVRAVDSIEIKSELIYLKIPQSAKPITKGKFEKMYELALKKMAYINRQSRI